MEMPEGTAQLLPADEYRHRTVSTDVCRWEHGIVGDRGYFRCDAPALSGRPWCKHHHHIYQLGKDASRRTWRASYG